MSVGSVTGCGPLVKCFGVGMARGDATGTSNGPWKMACLSQGGPTMGQLSEVYDPSLVSLLVPGMVVKR